MKLLPFTEECRQQLLDDGYTHVVLKRIIEAGDRDTASEKELHIYEAYKDGHPMLSKFISHCLESDTVRKLIKDGSADNYVTTTRRVS